MSREWNHGDKFPVTAYFLSAPSSGRLLQTKDNGMGLKYAGYLRADYVEKLIVGSADAKSFTTDEYGSMATDIEALEAKVCSCNDTDCKADTKEAVDEFLAKWGLSR